MLKKDKINLALARLPDNFSVYEFIDEVILSLKIEKALKQYENGEFLTAEELEEEIKTWD